MSSRLHRTRIISEPGGSFELPSPEVLAAYAALGAGMTEWFIRAAEQEAVHRRFVEKVLAVGLAVRPVVIGTIGVVLARPFL